MPDKFNLVKHGYDPSEVDSYIDSLETVLRSYKEKDSAIKNALINAQIAADNIVNNAEIEAKNMVKNAVNQLEDIYNSVGKQKDVLQSFQNEYTKMINTYLKEYDERDIAPIYFKISELEDYLNSLKKSSSNDNQ